MIGSHAAARGAPAPRRPLVHRSIAAAVIGAVITTALPLLAAPAGADAGRPGNLGGLTGSRAEVPGQNQMPGGSGTVGRDGDFSHSIPIAVPLGRKGQQPSVGLSYSSQGSVQGGVAAGWSLSSGGAITVDPAAGSARAEWPEGGSPAQPRNFLSAEGKPLVADASLPVASGAVGYRALGDASFARYEYLAGVAAEQHWWRVFRPDGTVARYGLKSQHPYSFAQLVSITDGDGHELEYKYMTVGRTTAAPPTGHPRELLPTSVEYWAPNTRTSATPRPYAKVSFNWDTPRHCGDPTMVLPIGARLDYRLGFGRLSGTRKLLNIQTAVVNAAGGFDLRRDYLLGYSDTDSCATGTTAPFRQLASVQETAYSPNMTGPGSTTVLPPVRFTYGKAASYTKAEHYGGPVELPNLRTPTSVDTLQHPYANPDQPTTRTLAPGQPAASCEVFFCAIPKSKQAGAPMDAHSIPWALAVGQATGESMTRMWVDVNADNRVDLLERSGGLPDLATPTNAPTTGGCVVDVYLNKGSEGFVKNDPGFPAFSLRNAMADVPVETSTPASGAGELLCSLNRSFSPDDSGGWKGDPSKPCAQQPEWDTTAGWGSMQKVEHAFFDHNGDGKVDLVSQVVGSLHCQYASTHGLPGPRQPSQADPGRDNDWQDEFRVNEDLRNNDSDDPYDDDDVTRNLITKRQNHLYVYYNTGSGFESQPQRVDRTLPGFNSEKPTSVRVMPTESLLGRYSMHWAGTKGWVPRDVTGDGWPDAFTGLAIRAGKPDGTFDAVNNVRFKWDDEGGIYIPSPSVPPPPPDQHNVTGTEMYRHGADGLDSPTRYEGKLADGLLDINGDGLPDQIRKHSQDAATFDIDFHMGWGWGEAEDGGQANFGVNSPRAQTPASFRVPDMSSRNWQNYPIPAERYTTRSMHDLDLDGIPDLLYNDEGVAKLHLGSGAAWVREVDADPAVARALGGRLYGHETLNQYADRGDYRYSMTHTAADINGDGLPDLVEAEPGAVPTVRYAKAELDTNPAHNAPARLMRTIDNGSGAITTVSYARNAPAGKWVVGEIAVDPGQGEPVMVTRHDYRKTTFAPSRYGRHEFQGFRETRVLKVGDPGTPADDLTSVTLYDYTEDHAGLPAETYTVLGDSAFTNPNPFDQAGQTGVVSITERGYHVKELDMRAVGMVGNAPSRVVLPKNVTTYTCTGTSGQTAPGCEATGLRTTTITTYGSHVVGPTYVMEKPVSNETRFTNADDKLEIRRTSTTANVAWSAAVFNVAPASSTSDVTIDGTTTPTTSTSHVYADPDFRYLRYTTVNDLLGQSPAPPRTTRFQYYGGIDAHKGLVYRTWAPEQVGQFGNSNDKPGFTEYRYDAHGVTVTRTLTPYHAELPNTTLHHIIDTAVDRATGATLETKGPDWVCADGADAGTEPNPWFDCHHDNATYKARVETKVDGLGRTRSIVKHPAGPGAGVEVARASYNDNAAFSSNRANPVSMVSEAAAGDGKFTHVTTEVDGLGRAVRTLTKQDNLADRITTFDYDHSGNNHQVFSPRADGQGGTIGLRTEFDALGRATKTLEVGTQEAGQNGKTLSTTTYDGFITTTSQTVGDTSKPAATRTTTDALGQLVSVAEATSPTAWATTHYRGDARGQSHITDPDGVVTDMTHNGFGERISITTGSKTWRYGYDRNGNHTTTIEPHPAGAEANYTHTAVYDTANRVIKEIPARRDLDQAGTNDDDYAKFKIGERVYTYDKPTTADMDLNAGGDINRATEAAHGVGKLIAITSPVSRVVHRYDHFGNQIASTQRLTALDNVLPNLPALDRIKVEMATDAGGTLESMEYRGLTPAVANPLVTHDGPKVEYGYDRDGSQDLASWKIGGKDLTITTSTNTAGLTTNRNINVNNTAGLASPQITYGYDRYGRATLVSASNGNVQRYKQTLEYFDNQQVKKITEQLGDTTKPINTTDYDYDHRHQLATATRTGGELTYTGGFTHTPGGRMNSASVAAVRAPEFPNPIGERVTTRNVDYIYNPTNLQQLDKLRRPDATDLNSYTYDEAGNTKTRTLSDGTIITQVWDGTNLRKVTKPDGGTETYFYDGHERIAAVLRNADGTVNTARRWFGAVEVVHQPGKVAAYRQNIALGGDTIARHDGDDVTGKTEHVLTSPQSHHVLALKAADGTTMRVAAYGPYGEVLSEFINQANLPDHDKYTQEFNGKTYDPASGLHYYGHRYYDSAALQWTSADPLFRHNPDANPVSPRAANLYTYTSNNPVNMVDPNGLCSVYAKTGTGDCHYNGAGSASAEITEIWNDFVDWLGEETRYPDPLTGRMEPGQTNGSRLVSVAINALHDAKADGEGGHASPRPRLGGRSYGAATVSRPGKSGHISGAPHITLRPASNRSAKPAPYPMHEFQETRPYQPIVGQGHESAQRHIGASIANEVKARQLPSGKIDAIISAVNESKPGNQPDAAFRVDQAFKTLFGATSEIHQSGPNLIVAAAHPGNGPVIVVDRNGNVSSHFADVDMDAMVGGPSGVIIDFHGFTLMDNKPK